jgi:hypothetical protein
MIIAGRRTRLRETQGFVCAMKNDVLKKCDFRHNNIFSGKKMIAMPVLEGLNKPTESLQVSCKKNARKSRVYYHFIKKNDE